MNADDKLLYWGALLIAVLANIAANTSLKIAVGSIERSERGMIVQLAGQVSFWAGLAFAAILLVAYLVALRGLPASVAYVTVSTLAMIGLVGVDNRVFDVPVSVTTWLGIAFAVCGVWLMRRAA